MQRSQAKVILAVNIQAILCYEVIYHLGMIIDSRSMENIQAGLIHLINISALVN